MAELKPFRGVRYQVASADAGKVIAPPYDVISAQQQEGLYALSPYNVIRLEYPREQGEQRYRAAAATLAGWTEAGILAPEGTPALYLYEQVFTHGGRNYARRAVLGRVRLEPIESGVIRPHEFTMAGPKEDRRALLSATRTNISPIFSMIDDPDGSFAALLARVDAQPVIDAQDFVGQRHRLTVLDDPQSTVALTAAAAARTLYIADGHHRFETALNYQRERREAASNWTGDEPENYVLMAIASTRDPGLLILPIHRLVHPRRIPDDAIAALQSLFDLEEIGASDDPGARARLVERLRGGAGRNTFGAVNARPGSLHLLTLRDRAGVEARMPGDHPPAWKALDVNVLQYGILEPVYGIDAAALSAGEVEFSEDDTEAFEAVGSGHVPVAFLVNATRPEDIVAVADAGDRMPQKSTYFYPKLGTGLVLNALDMN
jgi:uncharacterized protein (DUF1015 family)